MQAISLGNLLCDMAIHPSKIPLICHQIQIIFHQFFIILDKAENNIRDLLFKSYK